MNYLTLGLHYPRPEHLEDVLAKAAEVSALALGQDGIIDAGAWLDAAADRVVMMSLWASEEAAREAQPILRPVVMNAPWSEWENVPSDNMTQLIRKV